MVCDRTSVAQVRNLKQSLLMTWVAYPSLSGSLERFSIELRRKYGVKVQLQRDKKMLGLSSMVERKKPRKFSGPLERRTILATSTGKNLMVKGSMSYIYRTRESYSYLKTQLWI